ncbi:short transient receptor potential channel 4-like isoform X1 [Apostichopus japonicus]|uniref:short transient receptor potential channel 4-like isoform X1 n=2 Tax=Stichopus japonicus TaxID=307972 RepID=UPI003AB72B00
MSSLSSMSSISEGTEPEGAVEAVTTEEDIDEDVEGRGIVKIKVEESGDGEVEEEEEEDEAAKDQSELYFAKGMGDPSSVEQLFLQAVERGDRKAILYALENAPDLNINCQDEDGRSALIIAIQNGNSDIVKILLDNNIQLGDSLLRAVDEQFTPAVRLICEHIKKKNIPEALNCRALNGDFHPDVTPLVLSAQHNHYEIIRILLEYGARIKDPRDYSNQAEMHTLENSVGMLNLYKALASQAYISLTAKDPFNTTFELCAKLRKLSKTKYEFMDQFQELADQCEQFAADLLDQVRDSEEQAYILNHDPYGWSNPSEDITSSQPNRVKVGIHFEQRKFVAHSHCQQRLIEQWYHGLPGWRDQGSCRTSSLMILMGLCFPILSCCYIFSPCGKIGRFLRVPYVKFVCHTASQIYFLGLLLLHTLVENQIPVDEKDGLTNAGAEPPSVIIILIMLWVAGMTWSKLKELWYNGTRFFNNLWNYFDFFSLSLYWCFIALRLLVYLQGLTADQDLAVSERGQDPNATVFIEPDPFRVLSCDADDPVEARLEKITEMLRNMSTVQNEMKQNLTTDVKDNTASTGKRATQYVVAGINLDDYPRLEWNTYDPQLIAEALFAIAKVMSFLRMISLTVVNRYVGPMQISLGGMLFDIIKFLLIFCFVWFAFSLGMNQLYWYYSALITKRPFGTLGEAMATLFWALFGLPDISVVDFTTAVGTKHYFTQTVGNLLYATYHVIAIVVLLNVLIAMMSNTYTRVEMDADIEWKFSRSKLWMSYFDELGTVPPPFNILPSPKSLFYFLRWLFCDVCCRGDMAKKYKERLKSIVDERQLKFKEVSENLVKRYHFEKRHQEEEDDQANILNELKQDISGFKFEMFEALGEMDKKIRQVEAKVHDRELDDDDNLGTGMFQAMRDAMREPSHADSMESLSSGCSDQMVDMSKANDQKNARWMMDDDLELTPLVPVNSGGNRALPSSNPIPNGLQTDLIQYIDEEEEAAQRNTML